MCFYEKKIFPLCAIIIALFCSSFANAQDRLWFISSTASQTNYAFHALNKDGSGLEQPMRFPNVYAHLDYGKRPVFMMQASDGVIYGLSFGTKKGGAGMIFKITADRATTIHQFSTGNALYLTEGKDGFLYGVGRPGPNVGFIYRLRPDGTGYQQTGFKQYGYLPSEIMTASTGEVFGVSQWFIYKIKSDFSGIQIIHNFEKATGTQARGNLIQGPDGYLYGVTDSGGRQNYGVIYKIKPSGEDYQVLYHFDNVNGRYPDRGLAQDDSGNLYGVTSEGGKFKFGAIYTLRHDGSGFQRLYDYDSQRNRRGKAAAVILDGEGNLYSESTYPPRISKFNIASKTHTDLSLGSEIGMMSNLNLFRALDPTNIIVDPANNSTENVIWGTLVSGNTGAAFYRVQLSESPEFTTVLTGGITDTGNGVFWVANMQYATKYYARVRSSFWPGWGPTTNFTTHAAEKNCRVSKPASGTTNVEAPTLKVTANQVTYAKRYTVELSTSPDFTGTSLVKTSAIDGQRTLTFEGLQFSTTYYARQKTDICGYGKTTNFTTKADPEAAMVSSFTTSEDMVTLDVHPNPSVSNFNVSLNSMKEESAKVIVTDLRGETLLTHDLNANQSIQIGDELRQGIYIMKIIRGKEITTRRIVKK